MVHTDVAGKPKSVFVPEIQHRKSNFIELAATDCSPFYQKQTFLFRKQQTLSRFGNTKMNEIHGSMELKLDVHVGTTKKGIPISIHQLLVERNDSKLQFVKGLSSNPIHAGIVLFTWKH